MAQFTVYSSTDPSAPVLEGTAGALLTVLDAVLVNGYPGKAAAGWTKPIANSGNLGHYKQGAGSGFFLYINDNGPNGTSTFKEAWATGWETMSALTAPVGVGTGQFPTPAQLLTSGHTSIRKSTTADGTDRPWVCFADSRTFYLFMLTGDGTAYYHLWFGDLYSIKNSADAYNCFISGGSVENSATAANHPWDLQTLFGTAQVGCFVARVFGGGGVSITMGKHGDYGKAGSGALLGLMTTPNGPDSSYYMSPIWAVEVAAANSRGRLRGLHHVCHPIAGFSDGQVISGAVDYAGKTLQIVKAGPSNGMVAVETSNTLETN